MLIHRLNISFCFGTAYAHHGRKVQLPISLLLTGKMPAVIMLARVNYMKRRTDFSAVFEKVAFWKSFFQQDTCSNTPQVSISKNDI